MSRQRIRYLRTLDGVQLAWAEAGSGPVLVKAANWLSHLEYDWDSPVWRHWIRFLSGHFRFIRYDERGSGMSDWRTGSLSFERWVQDLEAVVEAAGVREPVALLGISQGAAICAAYAARHPERVSRLVLYGGYVRGWNHRPDSPGKALYKAIVEMARVGWGQQNPAFRQVFTSRFIPGGSPEQIEWWNELCRRTTTPEIATELMLARADVDVTELLGALRVPTLVLHGRDDEICPIASGRDLAARIPGAEFVELESRNHVLLEQEPAWRRFCDVVLEFMGVAAPRSGEDPAFGALSSRERDVLALIAEGLGNAEIGERLGISEKTVRNHVERAYPKIGASNRVGASLYALRHGLLDP